MRCAGEPSQVVQVSLVEKHDMVTLPCQGGVEQLARKRTTRVGDHHKGGAELASLRLMHRDRIGELEDRRAVIPAKLRQPEGVRGARLGRERYVEPVERRLPASLPSERSGHNTDLAVRDVLEPVVDLRVVAPSSLDPDVDDFVAVDDLLGPSGLWDLPVEARSTREVQGRRSVSAKRSASSWRPAA